MQSFWGRLDFVDPRPFGEEVSTIEVETAD